MRWLMTHSTGGAGAENYLRWLERGRIETVVAVPGREPVPAPAGFDALLLAGGGDVDPALYGAAREPETAGVREGRDRLERQLIEAFLDHGLPVLGVCRGLQILNVVLGGALIQDVPRRLGERVREEHRALGGTDARHLIRVEADSGLFSILGAECEVNSAHHQAADPARLGHGLRIAARTPAGVIEAVEAADGRRILAVQWHPERMEDTDPAGRDLLRRMAELVSAGAA